MSAKNAERIERYLGEQNLTLISSIEANNSDICCIDIDEDYILLYLDLFKTEFEHMQMIDGAIEAASLPAVIVGGILLGLTLLICCSCGDKTQSHEFRLGELQSKMSEESLRKMKAGLVEMLVQEHEREMKEKSSKEPEVQLMTITKDVIVEETESSSSEEDTESEGNITRPEPAQSQIIYIPPALQAQQFDPTAVARFE